MEYCNEFTGKSSAARHDPVTMRVLKGMRFGYIGLALSSFAPYSAAQLGEKQSCDKKLQANIRIRDDSFRLLLPDNEGDIWQHFFVDVGIVFQLFQWRPRTSKKQSIVNDELGNQYTSDIIVCVLDNGQWLHNNCPSSTDF
jgi:hypothetical protein